MGFNINVMISKRFFQFLSLSIFALLVSCTEECKDCGFEQKVFYSNLPSISKITNQNFAKIDFFKTIKNDHDFGNVCGDNLEHYDNLVQVDTVHIDEYYSNDGTKIQILGGVTRLTTRTFTCK